MFFNNKTFLFIIAFTLFSSLQASKVAENVGPAQPTLVESNNYIVIFKPDVPSINIKNQIQKMKLHQVNTTSYTNSSSSSNTKDSLHAYKTIGKFRWYSAQFHTEAIENFLATNKTDDAVHYWVKDATFSLQEFVQTNPPSWVIKNKPRILTDN